MIRRVLVANRGEIAVRILRGCREMSIETVAVYSDADRDSLPVQLADRAVRLGPAPASESYLNVEAILEAARSTEADAIHPGYGFLSENADFAEACRDAGIRFIGPEPEVIRSMGLKIEARRLAKEAGVPLVPGSPDSLERAEDAVEAARDIGLPVLIKASAGGGGKGMRIVRDEARLVEAAEGASREAAAAFGNPSVYVERFVERPRHVEIQVLADTHGHAIHLFERECSIQRRHQKIVEESPSPSVTPDLRERMGAAALDLVRRVGYTNAGTVEFLLDESGEFYFLEMNTRLQVEHPVTELITGVDLVEQQLRIASGEKLAIRQEDLDARGHAIECRIYAEDPARDFLPSPGRILLARDPSGPGVRFDSAIRPGMTVTTDYDPILAKLVVHGSDREHAIRRMRRALDDTVVLGVATPLRFLARVLDHEAFRAGDTTTDFIERYGLRDEGGGADVASGGAGGEGADPPDEAFIAAALDAALRGGAGAAGGAGGAGGEGGSGAGAIPEPWQTLGRFAIGSSASAGD